MCSVLPRSCSLPTGLTAYGANTCSRRGGSRAAVGGIEGVVGQAPRFDRRWVRGCVLALGASLLAWFAYASSRQFLEQYLQADQFTEAKARAITSFSLCQVGWFCSFLPDRRADALDL